MSNYITLKSAVASAVYTNGNGEITGAGLQAVLLQIIDTVGSGYNFMGVANEGTAAGTPDANVFYIAPTGTYSNFGTSYTVPVGSIGVFSWDGRWSKVSIKIQDFTLGVTYTDGEDANAIIQSAIIRDIQISKIRFTIGAANDLNVLFLDSSDNQVAGNYYSSLSAIEETYTFMSGHANNIVMFNRGYLRDLVTANYGKTNYYIGGNFTAEAYDEQYFYLYRNVSDKMMTALGYGWTDSPIINNILPYAALTSDVKKIYVSMSTTQINIYLRDADGNDLRAKLVTDTSDSFVNDVVEIVENSTTTLTDGLFIINKSAINRVRERMVLSDYTSFSGTITNNLVYNWDNKYELFGQERTRNWGTTPSDVSSATYTGANIYNTVDAFRFPAVITSITIPVSSDGILEIYRCRLDDVEDVSKAELLFTIKAKAGTHEYPCRIFVDAGDGIGFACTSHAYFDTSVGWRLASYDISTLVRSSNVTGFTDGAMVAKVKYRYFEPHTDIRPLSGINISVIGDSVSTYGEDYSYSNPYYPSSNVVNYLRTWWGRLEQDGAKIVKNMSVSQSTVISRSGDDEHRWIGYPARIENLLDSDGNAPNVILVLAGINDMFTSSALTDFDFSKNITTYSELDTTKFCTAYQYVVMKLLDLYPTSKIFLGTPFKCGNGNWGFPEVNGSRYLYQINEAIRTLAKNLGVGLIDFYAETDITYQQMNTLVYANNIHPNSEGHYKYYLIARKHLIDYVQKKI